MWVRSIYRACDFRVFDGCVLGFAEWCIRIIRIGRGKIDGERVALTVEGAFEFFGHSTHHDGSWCADNVFVEIDGLATVVGTIIDRSGEFRPSHLCGVRRIGDVEFLHWIRYAYHRIVGLHGERVGVVGARNGSTAQRAVVSGVSGEGIPWPITQIKRYALSVSRV